VSDDDAGRRFVRGRCGQDIEVGSADAARLDAHDHIVIGDKLRRLAFDILQDAVATKNRNQLSVHHHHASESR
jgi:hypothetical protein